MIIRCVKSGGRRLGDDASVAGLGAHVGLAAQGRSRGGLPREVRRSRRRLRDRRSVSQSQQSCENWRQLPIGHKINV